METATLHIILADDDKDDRFLFSEAIEELSIPVELTIVDDGAELMQRLKGVASDQPDAIFIDLNMPRKNGFECLHEINTTDDLKGLPIIVCSTSFDQELADRLYKLGAYFFIHKPSDFRRLKKVLRQAFTDLAVPANSKPSRKNFALHMII